MMVIFSGLGKHMLAAVYLEIQNAELGRSSVVWFLVFFFPDDGVS